MAKARQTSEVRSRYHRQQVAQREGFGGGMAASERDSLGANADQPLLSALFKLLFT